MFFNRVCPHCQMDRIPDAETVTEGRRKYVVYTCRVCNKHDIERWADRPRPRVWDGKKFVEDGAYFEEDSNDGGSDER